MTNMNIRLQGRELCRFFINFFFFSFFFHLTYPLNSLFKRKKKKRNCNCIGQFSSYKALSFPSSLYLTDALVFDIILISSSYKYSKDVR